METKTEKNHRNRSIANVQIPGKSVAEGLGFLAGKTDWSRRNGERKEGVMLPQFQQNEHVSKGALQLVFEGRVEGGFNLLKVNLNFLVAV